MPTQSVSFWAALVGGLASFFSPCVLPLIPVYLGYMMGGVVPNDATNQRLLGLRHAAFFVLGFALAFVTLGAAAGALGRWLYPAMPTVMRVAGLVLVVFGLQMLGVLRLPFLAAERQVTLGRGRQGLWRSLLMGLAFAIGWSPCVGPVLSAILLMAAETRTAA
ncbi:MAG: cytochrome c biogenesis protein CcdA, partial [Anaerolineales bacterium]